MSVKGFTDIGNGCKALLVDHDPTSVATDASKGSLIVDANGNIYRKMDDGATTNVADVGMCKCNHTATVAPTADDDSGDGYSVGSHWYDVTADKAYVCLDATLTAAIWREIGGAQKYVDRGDPAAVDFSIGSGLTADGAWKTLDLSSIVPAAAASKLVHLRCRILDNAAESLMQLRKLGNSNVINVLSCVTAISGDSMYFDGWVIMDASRQIQYTIDNGMGEAEVTVAGWMI